MPTTVQIDEKTKDALLKYASGLQVRLGRRVTFDEAIALLVREAQGSREANEKFDSLFGSMAGDKIVWQELETVRRRERATVERKSRTA